MRTGHYIEVGLTTLEILWLKCQIQSWPEPLRGLNLMRWRSRMSSFALKEQPDARAPGDTVSRWKPGSAASAASGAAAFLNHRLAEILLSFLVGDSASESLVQGPSAPLARLRCRAAACFALALIDKQEYQDILLIADISESFEACGLTSFHSDQVMCLCRKLHFRKRSDAGPNPAEAWFNSAVEALSQRLELRDIAVSTEQRARRNWVW